MKNDRMLGMLTYLLRHQNVTAGELAAHFEVSRRTIHRYVDALAQAGIPVYCQSGAGGGIRLMEGFSLDPDTLDTLRGQGLAGVLNGSKIDLGSNYRKTLLARISLLKGAIEGRNTAAFLYHSNKGKSERRVEPYRLAYQWSSWYLAAYCLDRQDFRVFKLLRMDGLRVLNDAFEPRQLPERLLEFSPDISGYGRAEILFDASQEYRLIENYGADSYQDLGNETLHIEVEYREAANILSWILSFGDKAEVIHPPELREEVARVAKKLVHLYERQNG